MTAAPPVHAKQSGPPPGGPLLRWVRIQRERLFRYITLRPCPRCTPPGRWERTARRQRRRPPSRTRACAQRGLQALRRRRRTWRMSKEKPPSWASMRLSPREARSHRSAQPATNGEGAPRAQYCRHGGRPGPGDVVPVLAAGAKTPCSRGPRSPILRPFLGEDSLSACSSQVFYRRRGRRIGPDKPGDFVVQSSCGRKGGAGG